LDIWKTEIVLRRSKIFIATGIQIAVNSVEVAYYGRHLQPKGRVLILDIHEKRMIVLRRISLSAIRPLWCEPVIAHGLYV